LFGNRRDKKKLVVGLRPQEGDYYHLGGGRIMTDGSARLVQENNQLARYKKSRKIGSGDFIEGGQSKRKKDVYESLREESHMTPLVGSFLQTQVFENRGYVLLAGGGSFISTRTWGSGRCGKSLYRRGGGKFLQRDEKGFVVVRRGGRIFYRWDTSSKPRAQRASLRGGGRDRLFSVIP